MPRRRKPSGEPIVEPPLIRYVRGEIVQRGKQIRVRYSSELEKLFGMRKLTEREFDAGNLLWLDFREAGLDTLKAQDPSRIIVDGGGRAPDPTTHQLEHLRRFRGAIGYLNHSYRDIVLSICCLDLSLTEYTMKYEDKLRKGFACYKLKDALGELARYYDAQFRRRPR